MIHGLSRKLQRLPHSCGAPPLLARPPSYLSRYTSTLLRHSTGCALAGRGMDTRRLQHHLGHASITNTVRYTAMSAEPFKDIWR
jgi:integrase